MKCPEKFCRFVCTQFYTESSSGNTIRPLVPGDWECPERRSGRKFFLPDARIENPLVDKELKDSPTAPSPQTVQVFKLYILQNFLGVF